MTMEYKKGMTQQEGYEYAMEVGLINSSKRGQFYKLFKSVLQMRDLTHLEKIVLVIILSYTDNRQEFTMSNKVLAFECAVDASTISKSLTALQRKALIKVYRKMRGAVDYGRVIKPQILPIIDKVEEGYGGYILVECM